MNWKVEFNAELSVVILTYDGFNSARDIFDSSLSTINLTNKFSAFKILVESRNFLTDSNRADIFRLPAELYTNWGMNRTMRIALIEPKDPDARNITNFYELATKNLGWDALVFRSRKSAMQWLQED